MFFNVPALQKKAKPDKVCMPHDLLKHSLCLAVGQGDSQKIIQFLFLLLLGTLPPQMLFL